MAVDIKRTDLSASDLRREAAQVKNARASRRMLALAPVLDGKTRTEAAQSCGWIGRRCVSGFTVTVPKGWPALSTGRFQGGSVPSRCANLP